MRNATKTFHSGRHQDVDDERWTSGFLGSLRPYAGSLNHEAFHDVMAAMRSLSAEFRKPAIERGLVADVLAIIHCGRAWALEPT